MANIKLPNQPNEADLSDFLSKVDRLDEVIKGMSSEDDSEKVKYLSKADDLIKEIETKKKERKDSTEESNADLPGTTIGFSKTSINKDAYKNNVQQQPFDGPDIPVDQKGFMAAMEADARERGERRKEREKIAAAMKEQGNAEFKNENFFGALEFYNKAMEQIKDNSALYTNRAQTRIKLGLYKEAISDCDWALRVWPKCLKAFVHKGHAYLGLKEFDKARENYNEILTIDPAKEEMVQAYINKVNRLEQVVEEEKKASKLMEDGDYGAKSVIEVLKSLKKENQSAIYYAGGLRMLAHLITDIDSQTLFRTHDGMKMLSQHPVISRCLSTPVETLSAEEKDLISSACDMLTAACRDNDVNQDQLLTVSNVTSHLLSALEASGDDKVHQVKSSLVNLLHEISKTATGRTAIVINFDMKKLVVVLLRLMKESYSFAETAAAVLNNLALYKKLKALLRDDFEDTVVPELENVLKEDNMSQSKIMLVSLMATNLAMDKPIRCKMVSSSALWNVLGKRLKSYSQSGSSLPVESLLGLYANITTETKSSNIDCGLEVVVTCFDILQSDSSKSDTTISRALKVISNILPSSSDSVSFMDEKDRSLAFLNFLQSSDLNIQRASLKCVAILTKQESISTTIADNKGSSALLHLLNHEDENVIGNAALCLSHMCSINKVCSKLTKTNIIQKLLVLARDGRNKNLQSNSAILIGKLVQGDKRHLQKLRELHGVEILHQCMKNVE